MAQRKGAVAAASGTLLIAAAVVHLAGWAGLRDAALVLATVIAGVPTARSAFRALRFRTFSIDLLVTIAVTGALVIGEFVESSVVAFLFVFGAWLEARTLAATRASVRELVEATPTEASVLRDGVEQLLPVDDIDTGDLVVVRAGDRVPVDGIVAEGTGHVAQAAITGEPGAVGKETGEQVWAGTTVEDGFLTIRATAVGDDSTYARIIELVEDAQDAKTKTQRFLDRFSAIYTPAIVAGSLIVFAITRDIRFALTFLVIACPGALVIATPVAMVAGLGNGAKRGIIVKGGDPMERLAKIDTLALDKTGTLTEGRPAVIEVVPAAGWTATEALRLAGSLELASEHPLGRAIVTAARDDALELTTPTDVKVSRGIGISGLVDGREVAVGSHRLLDATAPADLGEAAGRLQDTGATVSYLMVDDGLVAAIAVADRLRPGVADSIARLRRAGIRRVVMLTGDNARAAAAIARQAGVDEFRAELLPEEKVDQVGELTAGGARVGMVGDGLNDAPALAAAHLGIAMGAGTDVSVETADVILAGNRIDQLAHGRELARATVATMRQNTAFALATVAFLLAGVLVEAVHMASGMLIHEASVLLVIINATRLIRFRGSATRRSGPATGDGSIPDRPRDLDLGVPARSGSRH